MYMKKSLQCVYLYSNYTFHLMACFRCVQSSTSYKHISGVAWFSLGQETRLGLVEVWILRAELMRYKVTRMFTTTTTGPEVITGFRGGAATGRLNILVAFMTTIIV